MIAGIFLSPILSRMGLFSVAADSSRIPHPWMKVLLWRDRSQEQWTDHLAVGKMRLRHLWGVVVEFPVVWGLVAGYRRGLQELEDQNGRNRTGITW